MMDFLKGTVTPRDWAAVAVMLAVTGLLAVGFFFFVAKNQEITRQQLSAELAQATADLAKANDIRKNIDALREETQKIERLVEEFEKRLPLGSEIQTLLEKFEALAADVGVDVELSKGHNLPEGMKEIIPYEIVAKGNFFQIVDFINRLERFERYLKISDLHIGPQKEGVSEVDFTLTTYRFLKPGTDDKS